jgi:hypothetical protein
LLSRTAAMSVIPMRSLLSLFKCVNPRAKACKSSALHNNLGLDGNVSEQTSYRAGLAGGPGMHNSSARHTPRCGRMWCEIGNVRDGRPLTYASFL